MNDPFIKVFYPRDFDSLIVGEQAASIIDVHSRGIDKDWLTKKAAAGVFSDMDISPEKGSSYIHLIALGDADRYGQNRNGDIFLTRGKSIDIPYPEKSASKTLTIACGNEDRMATFEKHAKVYRNHVNKKDSPSYGTIVKAAHNPDMCRGELIIKVATDEWDDDLTKLASGTPIDFSMAARVPYDYCSYCGHKARSRSDYCDHAKDHMTAITKEGHQVGVINDYHTFFDISRVPVRADRIAQGLLKAASAVAPSSRDLLTEMYFEPPPAYGDDIVNNIFRTQKLAALERLAAIEKEIEAQGDSILDTPTARSLVKETMPDLSEDVAGKLAAGTSESVEQKLAALADVNVILSLPDFMKLVVGRNNAESMSSHICGAEKQLPGIFGKMRSSGNLSEMLDNFIFDDSTLGVVPSQIKDIIGNIGSTHGRSGEPAIKRISISVIRKKGPRRKGNSDGDELKKEAAVSKAASKLAEAYAQYVVAVCARGDNKENNKLTESAVMQNYVY